MSNYRLGLAGCGMGTMDVFVRCLESCVASLLPTTADAGHVETLLSCTSLSESSYPEIAM